MYLFSQNYRCYHHREDTATARKKALARSFLIGKMSKLYQYKLIYTKQENLSSWVTDVGNSGNSLTLKTFRKYWLVPGDLLQMKYAVLLKTGICCFFFIFLSSLFFFSPCSREGWRTFLLNHACCPVGPHRPISMENKIPDTYLSHLS